MRPPRRMYIHMYWVTTSVMLTTTDRSRRFRRTLVQLSDCDDGAVSMDALVAAIPSLAGLPASAVTCVSSVVLSMQCAVAGLHSLIGLSYSLGQWTALMRRLSCSRHLRERERERDN